MVNFTQVSYFILGAYFDTGHLKYLFFFVLMSLYALIVCINVLLIVVICLNRSLHQPMYLLVCSLFVNELCGSTGIFPLLLIQLLSDTHKISAFICFLQIFVLYTYTNVEFCNLAAMSYDKYIAICHPLHYSTRMTNNRAAKMITMTWLYASLSVLFVISLTLRLKFCGDTIHKVFCGNYAIVKLACSDISLNNIYGLVYTFIAIFVPLGLIVYTYLRILKVCFSGSRQTRQKALSTCSPHLASMLNFFLGAFFNVMQSRFTLSNVDGMFGVFLSVYFFLCQPLFTPLLHGLNMTQIRTKCKSLLCGK